VNEDLFHELEEFAMNEQEIREAMIEWEAISAYKKNKLVYEQRMKLLRDQLSNIRGERRAGYNDGIKEGLKEGFEKGAIEGKYEIALEMIKSGFERTLIISLTKLSEEEICELEKKVSEKD
jgi:predicted transposase/invertase (TIGR01784 family)